MVGLLCVLRCLYFRVGSDDCLRFVCVKIREEEERDLDDHQDDGPNTLIIAALYHIVNRQQQDRYNSRYREDTNPQQNPIHQPSYPQSLLQMSPPSCILALDHIDESIREYEVRVNLDDQQNNADIVDLNLRVYAEDDERSHRVDEYRQQLKANAVISAHDADTGEECKR